jgi:hypothetical protein
MAAGRFTALPGDLAVQRLAGVVRASLVWAAACDSKRFRSRRCGV